MAIIPCPNQIGCESDYPVTNYSSEDPDPRSFIGFSTGTSPTSSFPRNQGGGGPRGQGPDGDDTGDGVNGTAQTGTGGDPPPLGSDYDNPIVTTFAESTESQAQAWDDAGNENVSAMTVGSNTGEPGGGIVLSNGQRPSVFGNDPQTWTQLCPDGTPFSFTVAANTYRALTKAKANAAALSFACKQAQLNILCLGNINGNVCVGEDFLQTILANTANIPVTFVITSGDLPSWVTASVSDDSVQLLGTPNSGDIDDSTFTITATDALGFSISKSYTISVTACDCEITTSTLDKFDQGQFYSFQLVSTAVEPALWELIAGTLPSGLSLDAGGVIFGTVNLINGNLDQTFTVKVTGDDGGTCSKTLTLEVLDYNNFPPGKKWRIKTYATSDMFSPLGGGCPCVGPFIPSPTWDGQFDVTRFAGFGSLQAAGTSEVVIPTDGNNLGTGPKLLHFDAYGTEWRISISCRTFSLSTLLWYGVKAGSNQGAKLDSPAGVYVLTSGLPFQPAVCGGAVSVEIEEYPA